MNTKRQSGFTIVEIGIGVVILVVIGLLGWKFFSSMQSNSQKDGVAQSVQTSDIDPAKLTDLADIATIQKSALEGKEGAKVTGIQLKTEDGKLVYQATLSNGSVLTFDATTGTKLSEEQETADDAGESLPANFSGGIGLARAVEVAKTTVPNSAVRELELEEDDGLLVYRIKFANEAQVDVNATTGAIIRSKAAKKEESRSKSKTSTKSKETEKEDTSSTRENETEHKSSSDNEKEDASSDRSGSDSSDDSSDNDSDDDNEDDSDSDHDDDDKAN